MLSPRSLLVACCISLGTASCVGTYPGGRAFPAAVPPPVEEARSVKPVLSARVLAGGYGGDIRAILRECYDMVMDIGGGIEFEGGVRIDDRFGLMVGHGSMDATASDPYWGICTFEQTLEHSHVRAEAYLPTGVQGEFVLSVVYAFGATLLDRCDNGFRRGTGYGFEAAYCRSIPSGILSGRIGLGHRAFRFGQFEVTGSGSMETDESLDFTYLFASAKVRF